MAKHQVKVKVNAASAKGNWSSGMSLDKVGDPDLLSVSGMWLLYLIAFNKLVSRV